MELAGVGEAIARTSADDFIAAYERLRLTPGGAGSVGRAVSE